MNQLELERERGEFEKWARPQYEAWAFDDPTEDGWENASLDSQWRAWQARAGLSSQQSTLRRVRAILGNSIIIDADKPLVRDVLAVIKREFEGCSCGSHDLAPLYHHPKCALAPTAPSERADDANAAMNWAANKYLQDYGAKGGPAQVTMGVIRRCERLAFFAGWQARAGLSSQEEK